jgi:hypothetical protein
MATPPVASPTPPVIEQSVSPVPKVSVPQVKKKKVVEPVTGPVKKEFTPEERQEIYRLRQIGKTPKELAVKYHSQTFRIHKVVNSVKNDLEQKARHDKAVLRKATTELGKIDITD